MQLQWTHADLSMDMETDSFDLPMYFTFDSCPYSLRESVGNQKLSQINGLNT